MKSYSYDVEITKVECKELNIDYSFPVQGEWNIHKDESKTNLEFEQILLLFANKELNLLKDVFADFRRSIKYIKMTSYFCYRAIETIKIYYEKSIIFDGRESERQKGRLIDKQRQEGWLSLRQDLGYSESDFDEIEEFATQNRHGKYPTITYMQREKFMNFTRELIDKFIEKLKNEQVIN